MDSEPRSSEQIEEAAVRWFVRQQNPTWTDADQMQLDAWLEAETAHRIHYIRVANAWNHTARLKALGAGVPPGVIPPRGSWGDTRFSPGLAAEVDRHASSAASSGSSDVEELPSDGFGTPCVGAADRLVAPAIHRSRSPGWFNGSFVAAAIVLLLAAGIYTFSVAWPGGTRYSTPIGGARHVRLADGSRVMLNTDTRIRVSLTENERRIRLDRGEAFFEVARDKLRPFVVYAGDKRVIAVGTRFAVRRDEDDIRVIVTEGRVKLAVGDAPAVMQGPDAPEPGGSAGAVSAPQTASPPATFLDAGAIARTAKSGILVRPDASSEAQELLSWRTGYVSFDNVPLAEAVAEFNRYHTRKIVIEDPAIAAVRVGGHFRSTNTAAFLDLLQSGFPIAVEQEDDRVVLRAR